MAGRSALVEPALLLKLTNASLGLTVAEPDARSALELGYGTGPHGEFPQHKVTLVALFKDRCDSGKLKMKLKPGERYLLTALGPNDIDVIGYFLDDEVKIVQGGSSELPKGGNDDGEAGGDDGVGDGDTAENFDKTATTKKSGNKRQTESRSRTKTTKVTTRGSANAATPALSEAGSSTSAPRRPGRPTKAEQASRLADAERRAAEEVEAAAKRARREEEEADRKVATIKRTHGKRTVAQGNLAVERELIYQGALIQGDFGGDQYGEFFQDGSHAFTEGSSKGKEKA